MLEGSHQFPHHSTLQLYLSGTFDKGIVGEELNFLPLVLRELPKLQFTAQALKT